MKALVYQGNGRICLEERPEPALIDARDAIVKVTCSTICTSDLHIKNGAVPRAVPGIILGHEFTRKLRICVRETVLQLIVRHSAAHAGSVPEAM